jgi:hypothetical protein
MVKLNTSLQLQLLITPLVFCCLLSCSSNQSGKKKIDSSEKQDSVSSEEIQDAGSENPVYAMLILPKNPAPGEDFRIVSTGGASIGKATIEISGPNGTVKSNNHESGKEYSLWRLDNFSGSAEGKYKAILMMDNKEVCFHEFEIAPRKEFIQKGSVWKTTRSWDSGMETLYSAWINALFGGSDEQASWNALHEVTQNKENNFLYDYLSLGEDDSVAKNKVFMEPDCADNPFFLRAYFSWKLGLPFGFHICNRGYVGHNPQTGEWVTNETSSSAKNPVQAFNTFLRTIMNGVHSGTGRTSLDDEMSDYYPVTLTREALRPGTVFADPYGHTLILISWVSQTKKGPGLLLAVDAQPDNTIAIKRFWKGNFLFNTSEVVGEPGFKTFRPITVENGKMQLVSNESLTAAKGYAPFSLQQRKMKSEDFYLTMDRLINPKPLDPEDALLDLIQALHEQLQVRVKSVANGEAYFKAHPGTLIPMPTNANGIFLAGGQWEDFSTPNRDLRLLIAMDAVLSFPERVAQFPDDYAISKPSSPEEIQEKLQLLLEKKVSELTITYTRSDGSSQKLTIAEILKRRDAFEMAYNPNDGVEIRWGAPEQSKERSTCHRQAPVSQQKTMQSVRKWFNKRLHPPT